MGLLDDLLKKIQACVQQRAVRLIRTASSLSLMYVEQHQRRGRWGDSDGSLACVRAVSVDADDDDMERYDDDRDLSTAPRSADMECRS